MKTFLLFSCFFFSYTAFSQGTWTQKSDIGGNTRLSPVGFSIGTKGYCGTGQNGSNYYDDFWEWDQATNTWTQKANFGGGQRVYAVGFSIGNKGYIGTGLLSSTSYDDFWEYDPALNSWLQKANFPGTARYIATGFSIGNKGYISTGFDIWSVYCNDLWEWDQATDTWLQKSNLPGLMRAHASGFAIGNKGYVSLGRNGSMNLQDLWEWDQVTNTWTQKANLPGNIRHAAVGIATSDNGYICTGWDNSNPYQDFWQWNQMTNTWTAKTTFTGAARGWAIGFSIGPLVYAGMGWDASSGTLYRDLWEWSPFMLSIIGNNPLCFGDGGTATVMASGGQAPYTYLWNSNPVQTTATATGLPGGTYTVIVTDNSGSTNLVVITITEPPPLSLNVTSSYTSCGNCCDGSASAAVSGGTPSYTYLWMPTGATTANVVGLCNGTYLVCVTDANGCSNCTNVTVSFNVGNEETEIADVNVRLFPNPFTDEILIDCTTRVSELKIFNSSGQLISSLALSATPRYRLNTSGYPPGIYFLELHTGRGMKRWKMVK